MRQLRDGAGLGPAELAARAHYPYDRIRAAEAGPALPDLPVLSAYVRGCGGTSEEWEERWRSLTSAPTLPLLATRPAGSSTAADAGARIGSISPAAETPDPSVILAALDRVAEGMAVGNDEAAPESSGWEATATPAAWETGSAWETDNAPAGWQADEAAAIVESVVESRATAPAPTIGATPTAPTTPARPAAPGKDPALSRNTIMALVALVVCVLIAVLAIFG